MFQIQSIIPKQWKKDWHSLNSVHDAILFLFASNCYPLTACYEVHG